MAGFASQWSIRCDVNREYRTLGSLTVKIRVWREVQRDQEYNRRCTTGRGEAMRQAVPLVAGRSPGPRPSEGQRSHRAAHQDQGVAGALTNPADPQTPRTAGKDGRFRLTQQLIAVVPWVRNFTWALSGENQIGVYKGRRFSLKWSSLLHCLLAEEVEVNGGKSDEHNRQSLQSTQEQRPS
jgi:hypothetical protein